MKPKFGFLVLKIPSGNAAANLTKNKMERFV
jgi:hypothetical protein